MAVQHRVDPHAARRIADLFRPHIDSFDDFLEDGLLKCVERLQPQELTLPNGDTCVWWISEADIGMPTKGDDSTDARLFPADARERGLTYAAPLFLTVNRQVNGRALRPHQQRCTIPVMVKSTRCHLKNLSPEEMVEHHEEPHENGGFFVTNGLDKLFRMLILPRRNYVVALIRSAFQKRGPEYTHFGCQIRCVGADQSGKTITLHYLTDGTCNVRFTIRKNEYFIPAVIMLRALSGATDREIYENLVEGDHQDTFLSGCAEILLRDGKRFSMFTRDKCLAFLGSRFRIVMGLPERHSDLEVGRQLLHRFFFIHLGSNNTDKYRLLIFMIRKLYALVNGRIAPDDADALTNQEVLLPGHFYQMVFKEKLEEWLYGVKIVIQKDLRDTKRKLAIDLEDESYFKKVLERVTVDIGKRMTHLLSTGNLQSQSGLDLLQVSGYSLVAEKLNYLRYLSHFRSIHRGQFFAEMKTTEVRRLLPESWGFLCPVHTPDGAPCGLLNHLTASCEVVTEQPEVDGIPALLASLGMQPVSVILPDNFLTVMLDGRVIGRVTPALAEEIVRGLHYRKAKRQDGVPRTLEVGYIPRKTGGPYPGIYLFSSPARFMRPVKYLPTGDTEWIGSMEQVYMSIACLDEDIRPGTMHQDPASTNMLSLIANLVPFCDFNQSPRNMYQCQMGKQTMGFPFYSFKYRVDNKIYRLSSPQTPIVRTRHYEMYNMDEYPTGTNAIVAVISYTGYDMEDAMILKKSSFERGLAHGSLYVNKVFDLTSHTRGKEKGTHRFGNRLTGDNKKVNEHLDDDGLPYIGQRLQRGDPLCCIIDDTTNKAKVESHKSMELAFVDQVRLIGTGHEPLQKLGVKLRFPRNPVIGDKFSSRHGQKGVLAILWPEVDMPFSESGMSPDIIINPHAFPSRMTIGMLVESMAGKSGSLHGIFQDSTPFQFSESDRAVDFFGEQLLKAGYNYYGNEPMYSGLTGEEFKADIFIGTVYYQRLRHMVSDKYQVRGKGGPVNDLTRQPIKGRKVGGGIRFGEMERDSLLAHGTSFLLQDRLLNCSDQSRAFVCRQCGSVLSTVVEPPTMISGQRGRRVVCRLCDNSDRHVVVIPIPFVFRYLSHELAAMNIRMKMEVK